MQKLIGKLAFVFELCKVSVGNNGIFIHSKVYCTKTESHTIFIEAIKYFCDNFYLNNKIIIAKYKLLIIEAVGKECKLLMYLIPNLKSVIGEQLYFCDSYMQDAKNRFNYVFIKLAKAICSIFLVILV